MLLVELLGSFGFWAVCNSTRLQVTVLVAINGLQMFFSSFMVYLFNLLMVSGGMS